MCIKGKSVLSSLQVSERMSSENIVWLVNTEQSQSISQTSSIGKLYFLCTSNTYVTKWSKAAYFLYPSTKHFQLPELGQEKYINIWIRDIIVKTLVMKKESLLMTTFIHPPLFALWKRCAACRAEKAQKHTESTKGFSFH